MALLASAGGSPDSSTPWIATETLNVKPILLGLLKASTTFDIDAPGASPPAGIGSVTSGIPAAVCPDLLAKVTVPDEMFETSNTSAPLIVALETFVSVTTLLNVFVVRFRTRPDFATANRFVRSVNACGQAFTVSATLSSARIPDLFD